MRYHLSQSKWPEFKKSTNNKCWRGCGVKGTLLECWWECKLVQPLWKIVWKFLRKLQWRLTLVIPWTVARQSSLSVGFSRQEYWSGLPCSPPGDIPNPGIKSRSSASQVDSLPSEPPWKPKNTGVGSLSLL